MELTNYPGAQWIMRPPAGMTSTSTAQLVPIGEKSNNCPTQQEIEQSLLHQPFAADLIPLEQMQELYLSQGYMHNAVTDLFWSVDNLTSILNELQRRVEECTKIQVRIAHDHSFFIHAAELANYTPNQFNVPAGVAVLNHRVIEKELPIHVNQIRRRKLRIKWFINQDHPKYFQRPIDTHGRRRLLRPSSEGYYLNDPDKQRFCDFRARQTRNTMRMPALFQRFYGSS